MSTQHFIVEYRRHNTGLIDQHLQNSGILIYRVDTTAGRGNMEAPDEIYLYRPNGTLTSNGQIHNAQFSVELGRTSFNDTTNPSSFLANGSPSGIIISNISNASATMSFTLTLPYGDVDPMPMNLVGILVDDEPVLNWTQSPGATGYLVYRDFIELAMFGPVTTFRDDTVVAGQTYIYSVVAIYGTTLSESTNNVSLTIPGLISCDDRAMARSETFLNQNFPNPFNPNTVIGFQISETGDSSSNFVNIAVYNIRGQLVRTLVDDFFTVGEHSVVWDGTDESGRNVSSGIYFYKMKTDNQLQTKKMILMK
jgi:hypothetical protein